VVNYRTANLVTTLIDSIRSCVYSVADFEVFLVVIDNHSQDDSVDHVQRHIDSHDFRSWAKVIAAPKNGGFSYGNNIAWNYLVSLNCEFIWLLNPDTCLLPGACEALIDCLSSDADAGIVGSYLQDPDGTGQIASFNLPTPSGELVNVCSLGFVRRLFPHKVIANSIPTKRMQVGWVAGASMMLKCDVIEKVGLMDEDYFLYFEEVDYCMAAQKSGATIYFEPNSRVVHHVGAATGISDGRKQASRRPNYWFESRRRFFQKNFGYGSAIIADLCWMMGYGLFRLKLLVRGKRYIGPPKFFVDFIRQSNLLKGRI